MLWSKLFIPTLRDAPAEAKNATHRLLIRAGYMRRQDYLFLGRRVLRKMVAIIREEMDAIGAQEMCVSSPLTIASELRSYKQLPQIWYFFREFTVECWSFGGVESRPQDAFRRVFDRCALRYLAGHREIVALSENGEPIVRGAGDIASFETAESCPQPPALPDPEGDLAPEEFPTPGQKTIADLSAFTHLPESSQMKSVVMVADQKPVLIMLRGDHQLSEAKLRDELDASELRPANPGEIREWFGADAGSLGPVGEKNLPILADHALRGRRNMICGANRNDYHLRNVTPGEDFVAEFLDLRAVAPGDAAVDGTTLAFEKGFRLAHFRRLRKPIFVTDVNGAQSPVDAASCRILLENVFLTAVEQQQDADGLALAPAVAPFTVVITPVSNDEAQQCSGREQYDSLRRAGIDALLDDRDERPGVKFKDADLIGVPYRVTVGKKLAQGMVEIRDRRARTSQDVAIAETVSFLQSQLK
ncbi:MAG TPA: YbaK/EbsC family protein [Bryobacteraceae bacterium]|nr:YbaK/EbsC family protein [Bryobacteraceae bacterium]